MWDLLGPYKRGVSIKNKLNFFLDNVEWIMTVFAIVILLLVILNIVSIVMVSKIDYEKEN